jgi:hypothetical protein
MSLIISNLINGNDGARKKVNATVAFDSSYPTGGETLTAGQLGMNIIENINIEDSQGYTYDVDIAAGGASAKIKAYLGGTPSGAIASNFTGTALASDIFGVKDDDSAASNGTEIFLATKKGKMEHGLLCSENENLTTSFYALASGLTTGIVYKPVADHVVNVTDDDSASGNGTALYATWNGVGQTCQLQSENAGNANSSFTCNDGGDTVPVIDNDDAALTGVPIYFYEDAADGDRFLINSPTGTDLYFQSTSGRYIKLTHVADPTADGIQVYFDDDAGNSYERLLFVSPTNTNGTNTNDSASAYSMNEDDYITKIYFDEDATDGERLIHEAPSAVNVPIVFIDTSDVTSKIRLVNIMYSGTASTDGVTLYFDDDGGTPSERLLFVSPTDTDGENAVDENKTLYGGVAEGTIASTFTGSGSGAGEEVANTTDLSSVSIDIEAIGR